MQVEEIEALWEQFTCLASATLENDDDDIQWAIDRRAFNQAFIPRYPTFRSKPNLVYDRVFCHFDKDYDGLIGFRAFVEGLSGMRTDDSRTRRKIVFDGYDLDGDGFISRHDMLRLFRAYYAIEKEAVRNHVIRNTQHLSVGGALDNIRSTNPLGSVFTEFNPYDVTHASPNPRLEEKVPDQFGDYRGGSAVHDDSGNDVQKNRSLGTDEIPPAPGRFQDNVDPKTPSSASHSSRAIRERWSESEMTGLEKDPGTEILYQVTQQGFSELLEPFFHHKEEYSLLASRTKGLRQNIEQELSRTSRKLEEDRQLCQKISQFSESEIYKYSKEVVSGAWSRIRSHEDLIQIPRGCPLTRAQLQRIVDDCYAIAEQNVWISGFLVPSDPSPNVIDVWHAFLVRKQIMHEFMVAVTDMFIKCGWLDQESIDPDDQMPESIRYPGDMINNHTDQHNENEKETVVGSRDPTWPQFRPNSLADSAQTSGLTKEISQVLDDPTTIEPLENASDSSLLNNHNSGPLQYWRSPPAFVEAGRVNGQPFEPTLVDRSEEPSDGKRSDAPIRLLMTDSGPSSCARSWESIEHLIPEGGRGCFHCFRCYISNAAARSNSQCRRLGYLAMIDAVERQNAERKGEALLTFDEFDSLLAKKENLRYVEMWKDCISF
jgi:Ca2+-binding EF-hand superfamily protein